MAGNDREPIGRKGKPTRPAKQKVSRRQLRDDEYDDDYDDDYEDEEPMPRKGKGKGRKPRGKRGWFWLLVKLSIVFLVLIAIYGVYLDQKSVAVLMAKSGSCLRPCMAGWLTSSQKCPSAKKRW